MIAFCDQLLTIRVRCDHDRVAVTVRRRPAMGPQTSVVCVSEMTRTPDSPRTETGEPVHMTIVIDSHRDIDICLGELSERLQALRTDNARLRDENRRLRAALDSHIAQANGPAVFGPAELTAGTRTAAASASVHDR